MDVKLEDIKPGDWVKLEHKVRGEWLPVEGLAYKDEYGTGFGTCGWDSYNIKDGNYVRFVSATRTWSPPTDPLDQIEEVIRIGTDPDTSTEGRAWWNKHPLTTDFDIYTYNSSARDVGVKIANWLKSLRDAGE